MSDKVPTIMENVFECTLEMINKDFSEYPQHRVEFFKLLKSINLFCFPALLKLDGRQFKFVIDSCMWASKHDNREVETTGLSMCIELMDNMAENTDEQTSSMFFQQFYITILQDVFFVLTDSDHKAGKCRSNNLDFDNANLDIRLQATISSALTDVLSCRIWQDLTSSLHFRPSCSWVDQSTIPYRFHRQSATKCFP